MNTQVTSKQVVASLREEAGKNPTFNAVCHILALRERSRSRITLASLMVNMKREGFTFSKESYTKVLEFLASLGLGKLDFNVRGQLRSIKGVKATLQSIGLVAISKHDILSNVPVMDVVPKQVALLRPTTLPTPLPAKTKPATKRVIVKIEFEGSVLTFECPEGIQPKDTLAVLAELYTNKPPPTDISQ